MDAPVVFEWTGEVMAPARGFAKLCNRQFVVGERYRMVQEAERSKRSHDHYFACVEEAWRNLPERFEGRWPTSEHLRKWALIRAGYRDERSIVAASKAEAQRVAAFVRPMDEYAVVLVSEAVVRVYTAQSQSRKAMGGKVFQQSKTDVLDVLARLVAVERGELERAAA